MPDTLIECSLAVDQAKIDLYADITDDYNPIHVDPAFAAKTEMGGVIAHGTMSMNLIWQSLKKTFGQAALAGAALEMRFLRPVRPGDVVTASGKSAPDAPGNWQVWVANQRGENVIEGTLRIPEVIG